MHRTKNVIGGSKKNYVSFYFHFVSSHAAFLQFKKVNFKESILLNTYFFGDGTYTANDVLYV